MSSMGETADASTSTPFSKDRLRDALDGVIARQFFAGWNKIEQSQQSRDPEIVVHGVGRIRLPLSGEQARQIISRAHRGPIDTGSSETIVDSAVQYTAWELGPQSFTITAQSQWDKLLKEFLTVISRVLGVSNRIVRADLHKLSIWENGAVFKAHEDTEKIPHMFGTLIISLPSFHRGGNVIVRYLDKEAVFSTYMEAMAGVYWYSDASHEVLPVEFGYRWVLTYNLVTTVSLEKPLEGPELENKRLREVMESWAGVDRPDDTSPLYYALDNKYTEGNLSLAGLESRDQACLDQLLNVCHGLDFHIFLATLELVDVREIDNEPGNRFPSLYIEHDTNSIGFRIDSELKAKYVCDLNGNEVPSSITIDKDSIMHSNPFGERADDKMDDEDVISYYYRISALVIVPPKALLPLLTSSSSDWFSYSSNPKPVMVLNYCIDRCQSLNSESALDALLQLLEKTGKPDQLDWTKYTVLAEKIYKLAMICPGSELIDWITRRVLPLPLTVLGWSRRQFEEFAISFERLDMGFSSVIQTRKSLNRQYQAILAFRADGDSKDELLGLLRDTPTKTISDGNWGSIHSYEEGLALYNLALCAHDGLEIMKSIVPRLVETCGQKTEFMLGFVHGWRQGMQCKEITLTDSQPIYENLVQVTVRNMSIPSLAVEVREAYRQNQNSTSPTRPPVSYGILYRFVVSLFQPGLGEQRDILIKKITFEATHINATNFEDLWIPLLQDLLFDSEELKIPLSDQSWQHFYQTVLESFLLTYVGKALPKPDLVRKPVSCSCTECRKLNQFLLSPIQRVCSFHELFFSQRTHALQIFPDSRNDCRNSGSPNFIITKVEDPIIEGERHSRAKRKLRAVEHLSGFDPDKLKTVLAEKHGVITTMAFLEHPEDTATTSLSASSSTQRRGPLAPTSANPTVARVPLGGEKIFPVDNTPPNVAPPERSMSHPCHPSAVYLTPTQPINGSATTVRTQTSASPQTTMSGVGGDGPSKMPSTHPPFEIMRSLISSDPYNLRRQEPGNPFITHPDMTATTSVGNPSRPLPSTMIPHPVAGVKRKMVELIDLTSEDD
ncbi:hypothetical protein F4859DRAFT_353251 [Xylaria cf. heliscus]|nr:hypothetical protein F4859DRAFT_353251 [Xylaria cf. heliscus]